MKRKLDENDVPVPAEEVGGSKKDKEPITFASFGLDPRLLQGISKLKFQTPTPVQVKAIPLALQGKDILARAKTGSGKTAAFVLPVLQSILSKKKVGVPESTAGNITDIPQIDSTRKCITALILVPTRELADQVTKVIESFSAFCLTDVKALNLTQKVSEKVLRTLLDQSPDVVVATPAGAALNFGSSPASLEHLLHLVIDEADLVLSYGYAEDLQNVAKLMPRSVRTILTSATLSPDIEILKKVFSIDPTILKLEEREAEGEGVSQYVVK